MERGDVHAAMIMSMLANVNRDQKKQRRPYKPEEFMPKWQAPKTDDEEYDDLDRKSFPTLADAPDDEEVG